MGAGFRGRDAEQKVKDNPSSITCRIIAIRVSFMARMINRSLTLRLLAQHKPELARRYGVTELALFGSTARDMAHEGSDVDILIGFDGPATSERYFGVQFYLEDLLGCPVDLVTDKALRTELKPYVEREAVRV